MVAHRLISHLQGTAYFSLSVLRSPFPRRCLDAESFRKTSSMLICSYSFHERGRTCVSFPRKMGVMPLWKQDGSCILESLLGAQEVRHFLIQILRIRCTVNRGIVQKESAWLSPCPSAPLPSSKANQGERES